MGDASDILGIARPRRLRGPLLRPPPTPSAPRTEPVKGRSAEGPWGPREGQGPSTGRCGAHLGRVAGSLEGPGRPCFSI